VGRRAGAQHPAQHPRAPRPARSCTCSALRQGESASRIDLDLDLQTFSSGHMSGQSRPTHWPVIAAMLRLRDHRLGVWSDTLHSGTAGAMLARALCAGLRARCRTMAWHARAAGRPAVAAAAASAMASVAIVATRCEPATVNEQLTSFLTRLDGIASALATPNSLVIRPGRAEDAEAILGMIHDLAILEKELEQVKMTAATLRRDGWPSAAEKAGGAQPRFESFIAELDGVAVGFALYFHIYSTWEGLRSGLMHPRSFDRPSIGPSCLSSTASRNNNSPP